MTRTTEVPGDIDWKFAVALAREMSGGELADWVGEKEAHLARAFLAMLPVFEVALEPSYGGDCPLCEDDLPDHGPGCPLDGLDCAAILAQLKEAQGG